MRSWRDGSGSGCGHFLVHQNSVPSVDPTNQLGRKPLPVEINLWLFNGQPPYNGREVELIVSRLFLLSLDIRHSSFLSLNPSLLLSEVAAYDSVALPPFTGHIPEGGRRDIALSKV